MESEGETEARTTPVAKATDGGLSQQFASYEGETLSQRGGSGRLRRSSSQDLQYSHESRWEKNNWVSDDWDRNHQEPKGTWKPRAASNLLFVGLVTVEDATQRERSQSRAEKGQSQRGGTEGDLLSCRQGLHEDVAGDTELKRTEDKWGGKAWRPGKRERAAWWYKDGVICKDVPRDKPPTFAAAAEEKLGDSSSGSIYVASDRPCQSGSNSGWGADPCDEHSTAATTVEDVGSTSHPQARQPHCRRTSVSGVGNTHPRAAITAEGLDDTSHPQARQAQCRKKLVTDDGDVPCRKHPPAATAPEEGFGNTSHSQARQSYHRKKMIYEDGDIPRDNHPTAKAAERELDKTTISQVSKHQSGHKLVSETGDVSCDNHPTAATAEEELDQTTHLQSRKHQSGKKSVSGNGYVPCDKHPSISGDGDGDCPCDKHLSISGDGDCPCDKHPEAPTAKEELGTAHPKAKKRHSRKKLTPEDGDVPRDTHPKATTAEEDFGDITHLVAKGPRHMKKLSCGDRHVPFDTHPKAASAAELGSSSSWSTDRPFQSGTNAACGDVPTPLGKELEAEAEEFVPQANTTVEPKADAEASQPLATDKRWKCPPPRRPYDDRLTAAMETYFNSGRYLRDVIDCWDKSQILVVREAVDILQLDCELLSSFFNYRASRLDKLIDRMYRHQEVPFSGTGRTSAWMSRERHRLEEAVAELRAEIKPSTRLQEVEAERDKALAEAQEASARAKEVEAERDQAVAEAKAGLKAWETEKVKMRFEARTALNNAQAAAQRERIAAAKVKSDLEAKLKREEEARQRHEELFCKICFSAPRNVVLLPCFHGHYCSGCIETHRRDNPTCPVCRTYITGTVPYTA